MEKYVCSNHIGDEPIRNYIKANSQLGKCDYCGDDRNRKVVPLDELVEFMLIGISNHYDEAGNSLGWDSAEGGYLGSTFDSYDLLYEEIGLDVDNNELQDDIVHFMPDTTWCYDDPYGSTKSDDLFYDWVYFKNVVKHKSRYSFFFLEKTKEDGYAKYSVSISEILREIGKLIRKYKLIKELPADTVFFRCRQHSGKEKIKTASEIAAPPIKCATFPNRMSPEGISMFYAAFDTDTAIEETIERDVKSKQFYSVGKFASNDKVQVVDFTRIPTKPSVFDIKKHDDYHPLAFLKRFVADLSAPIVRDGREHIEYVPTQIITEYIRFILSKKSKNKVGGIIYPSSRHTNKKASVLFLDNEESLKELKYDSLVIKNHKVSTWLSPIAKLLLTYP